MQAENGSCLPISVSSRRLSAKKLSNVDCEPLDWIAQSMIFLLSHNENVDFENKYRYTACI